MDRLLQMVQHRHTALLNYARSQNKKWYDLDLQLDFMLHGDSPYYQSWLKDFFKNTGSAANLAQLFLTYWEGNSGDKLLERQTRARNGITKLKRLMPNKWRTGKK